MKKTILYFVIMVTVLFWASTVWGQGCAMCYTSVTNSTQAKQAKSTINRAILILLVPPVTMFVGIFWIAYKSRNKFRVGDTLESELGPATDLSMADCTSLNPEIGGPHEIQLRSTPHIPQSGHSSPTIKSLSVKEDFSQANPTSKQWRVA